MEHGVRPPDFLVARAGKASASVALTSSRSCCGCSSSAATCGDETARANSRPEAANPALATDDDSPLPSAIRLVLMEDAARCHGIEMIWSVLSSVTTDIQSPMIAGARPPYLYSLPIGNDRAISVFRSPDPPVP
jgi:hypothetical protein